MHAEFDPTRISLQMTRPSASDDGDNPRNFELRVNDTPSGLPILRVKLTPNDLADLLSTAVVGSVEGVPADVLTRHMRTAVGSQRYTVTRVVPSPGDYNRRVEIVENWADQVSRLTGAMTTSISFGQRGVTLRWSAYFDNETHGAAWVAREQRVISSAVVPWEN